jgi:hypothetical protein
MVKDIIFRDCFVINRPNDEEVAKWKESAEEFSDAEGAPAKKGLRVTLEASHAGLINKNNRLYIPVRMKDGIPTWTTERQKPAKILKHHDFHSDPVGIIRDADFVDTTPGSLKKNADIAILFDSEAELEDQVEAINRLVASKKVTGDDWKGLGYTKLVADIYDPETIEQVLDGRLDSVSTSFRPKKKALCTVCKTNVMDSWCGHRPGKSYLPPSEEEEEDAKKKVEKILCMFVPDSHDNKECSFVTFDADPFTAVEVNGDAEDKDAYQDLMSDNAERDASSQEFEVFFQDAEEEEAEEEDAKLTSKTRKALPTSVFCGPNRTYPVHDKAHAINALARAKQHASPALYSKIKACVCRKFSGLPACGKDEEMVEVIEFSEEELQDLQAKQVRDPMTGKDILLGDYIFEAEKPKEDTPEEKIEETDDEDSYVLPSCSDMQLLEEDTLWKFFDLVHAEIMSRDIKDKLKERMEDKECDECKNLLLAVETLKGNVEDRDTTLKDKDNTIGALRNELRFYITDYKHQVDEYVKLGTEVANVKLEYLATLGVLLGKYDTRDSAAEEIKDSIEDSWTILTNEFNLEEARNKLNDGMSRDPKGTVDNPAHTIDEDDGFEANLSGVGKRAAKRLRGMIQESKLAEAKDYFDRMKNLRVFPKDINFEDFLATSTKAANDNN